ncbi:fimbrial protein [Salmonella enterica]|nr:fimbrial protein [Salmonella enterica]
MKKTVIAAALASTVFSGAAMAWTAGGTGGNVEIGGNIQITPYTTPWEVTVGAPVATLDANITKGTKVVMIPVTKAIPILGIRTVSKAPFAGAVGINPQISYNGAVQVGNFVEGDTVMDMPVMDVGNPSTQIGIMETTFTAAALTSQRDESTPTSGSQYSTWADTAGAGFWGGVGQSANAVLKGTSVVGVLTALNPAFVQNYNDQGVLFAAPSKTSFEPTASTKFSGVYGAGIQAGKNIKLTLTNPAANDVIKWKASLPVTISYQ